MPSNQVILDHWAASSEFDYLVCTRRDRCADFKGGGTLGKKVWTPAHRTYRLDLVGDEPYIAREGGRLKQYLPYGFSTEAEAQAMADEYNAKYGAKGWNRRLVVAWTDYEGAWSYEMGTIHLDGTLTEA